MGSPEDTLPLQLGLSIHVAGELRTSSHQRDSQEEGGLALLLQQKLSQLVSSGSESAQ